MAAIYICEPAAHSYKWSLPPVSHLRRPGWDRNALVSLWPLWQQLERSSGMEAPETFTCPPVAVSGDRRADGRTSYTARGSFRNAKALPQPSSRHPGALRQGPLRPSAKGVAPGRGPALRARGTPGLQQGVPIAAFVNIADLIQQTIAYHNVRDVCSLKASSRQLRDTCSGDAFWETLYRLRWPLEREVQMLPDAGWRQRFVERLRHARETFIRRSLPALMRKSRRRDGLPDLRKLHEALRIRYSMSIHARNAPAAHLEFSQTSTQPFDSAVCLRCSFASLQVLCPFRLRCVGRSSAIGREEVLLTADVDLDAWGDAFVNGEIKFVRSPCGRLLLAFWTSSKTLAGMYVNLTYKHIFQSLWPDCEAWRSLAGRPGSDDLDSLLGLHGYSLLLTLRGAKTECFANTFYKVAAFGLGRGRAGCLGNVWDSVFLLVPDVALTCFLVGKVAVKSAPCVVP